MVLISPRVHFFEINDQTWYYKPPQILVNKLVPRDVLTYAYRFPQYLREKVQSCLTLCWTFRFSLLQKASPAQLVASTLSRTLANSITDYTFVDFCAGAGGPTPYIEKELNAQLTSQIPSSTANQRALTNKRTDGLVPRSPLAAEHQINGYKTPSSGPVKFVLTDIHPHIPDWTEASKRSSNLTFISTSVDAANAPSASELVCGEDKRKVFRLYNLAFHHFDDELASRILKNTIEQSDGFG